ncbi:MULTISPECIES: phosphoribosylamine--glycine ligase [Pseudovibrio]|uniref:phosphoribosylamine--glycine ligase n=1 Tax=Stappiaceae TaxID=2821832 RepID=UPI002365495D|nr:MULTISPECIES: phosphoribosylamine--glycine ligase [Pseudovibrio]MDD7911319.1 phosphoribosylamine--glycine ligase [Pseudovibrio exalbescens]MDX5592994.1 phosphoribosylamine--glycine ligase [Pseudovibrio sp. SPO723]
MNVLLIGSGGREHALAWALSKSPVLNKLYLAPGNAGTTEIAENVTLDVTDHKAVVEFCEEHGITFVVVGPEVPLVDGIADTLEANNIRTFGPSKAAARLEGSKAFTKEMCMRAGVPTAAYGRFVKADEAKAYVVKQGAPIVIKADGLAAGKGVTIAMDEATALAAIDECFDGTFGEAGAEVVIEEFLEGEEASFFVLSDGDNALPLPTAQDHKRAFDNDEGPNTGGMGAYSPAPVMTEEMVERVMREIIKPTIADMKAQGCPFKGVLYAGLMITKDGPKLIEYNVRFGDPECQVLMMRLKGDVLPLLLACSEGILDDLETNWTDEPAITVVMAAKGYPGSYERGSVIEGLEEASSDPDVEIFHAGTKLINGAITASGGRVLNITARGKTVSEAQAKAYAAIDKIKWPEGFNRTDIGWRAIEREQQS